MKFELPNDFGRRLQARLDGIVSNLNNATSVEIGWNSEATYPDGSPVAQIAATNEFGGTVTIPEHEVSVYRKVDKSGEFAYAGKFVKADQSNFETTHTVPEHTVTIPARPFFRGMIASERAYVASDMGHALREADYNMARALGLMGEEYLGKLQESIRDFTSPANAPSTIRRKGFDDPLIDTGHMLQTANYTVK